MDFIDMFNLGPDRDERLLHHAMLAFDGANLLHVLDRRLKRAAAPRRSVQPPVPHGDRFGFGPFQLDVTRETSAQERANRSRSIRGSSTCWRRLCREAGEILTRGSADPRRLARRGRHRQQPRTGDLRIAPHAGLAAGPARTSTTDARRGYRFTATVTRLVSRETDASLDALLAPHRAWIEGRAALETLERDRIAHARDVFEGVLRRVPRPGARARRAGQRLRHAVRDDARRPEPRSPPRSKAPPPRARSVPARCAVRRGVGDARLRAGSHRPPRRRTGRVAARGHAGAGQLAPPRAAGLHGAGARSGCVPPIER